MRATAQSFSEKDSTVVATAQSFDVNSLATMLNAT